MKRLDKLLSVFLLTIIVAVNSSLAHSAQWLNGGDTNITDIRILSSGEVIFGATSASNPMDPPTSACKYDGETLYFKFDSTTEKGKNILAILLQRQQATTGTIAILYRDHTAANANSCDLSEMSIIKQIHIN